MPKKNPIKAPIEIDKKAAETPAERELPSSVESEVVPEPTVRELENDKAKVQELRKQVEATDVSPEAQRQVAAHAQSLADDTDQEKIKKLLDLAKSKGVVHAVKVAQKMNDPYLLDTLHDALANNGYYKNFLK